MKKLLATILTASLALSVAVGLTACGDDGKTDKPETGWGKEYTVATAYSKAVELGYDKSLEEFISTISGKNGKDGKDGKDGVGIKDVKLDDNGNLSVILTDDTTKNIGKVPYCTHSFSDWATKLQATCTSIGYGTRECEICGYIEYKFAEAKGHNWDDGEEFAGKILKTCTVCHATQIEEISESKPPEEENKPVEGVNFILPIDNTKVSVKYEFVYDTTLEIYHVHQGMDFEGTEGTSVKAVLDGTVTKIVSDHILNENYVKITHSNGLTTTYKYIVPSENLKEGDTVNQGDIIGVIAPAGGMEMNQGAHLHFEILANGKTVDPIDYFNEVDIKYTDNK